MNNFLQNVINESLFRCTYEEGKKNVIFSLNSDGVYSQKYETFPGENKNVSLQKEASFDSGIKVFLRGQQTVT